MTRDGLVPGSSCLFISCVWPSGYLEAGYSVSGWIISISGRDEDPIFFSTDPDLDPT